jgi:phenylpyruvate tautomerase PptA (4-oxalocrotonate tautomerase family)
MSIFGMSEIPQIMAILPLASSRVKSFLDTEILRRSWTMPMIDVVVPENALSPEAETRLMKELTDILIRAEGYEPTNKIAQSVSVLFLHRPSKVFVGGEASQSPRYRIVPSVPEGQYTEEARGKLVKEIAEAVARAEGAPFADVAPRVLIFPTEIPEGEWGGRGLIRNVADIHAMLVDEPTQRAVGEQRLARRRREKARVMLEAALDAARIAAAVEER